MSNFPKTKRGLILCIFGLVILLSSVIPNVAASGIKVDTLNSYSRNSEINIDGILDSEWDLDRGITITSYDFF